MYHVVQRIKIDALFDLIIDFPDSMPALEDLRRCIKKTKGFSQLIQVFGDAICRRLLHPGASTSDILHHYITSIRVLDLIDKTGFVLESISRPIKAYLRSRKDSIKCIVSLLTEDSDGSILQDMSHEEIDNDMNMKSEAAAMKAMQTWEPAPIEFAPQMDSQPSNKDVISMLTDIYGTKEMFVKAYRNMLSERLIQKKDFDCSRELKTLELLKIRFGESSLHSPEVMIRDITDSKRIFTSIKAMLPLSNTDELCPEFEKLKVLVISEQYWPSTQELKYTLPPAISRAFEIYEKKFHSLKSPRIVKWKRNLGSVSLKLTIGGEVVEFDATPLQASILLTFQNKSEISIRNLCSSLKLQEKYVLNGISKWVDEGILKETTVDGLLKFVRNEKLSRPAGGNLLPQQESIQAAEEGGSDMDYLEPFILGMLMNFDTLPLDRIHNMLKMFAVDPPYDKTIDDLKSFMSKLCISEKVLLEGKMYKKGS